MHFGENINSSLQSIKSHKLRSSLTLLGIIIGVFAVITMYSAVDGMKNLVMTNMEQLGWNNSLLLYPSADTGSTTTVSNRNRRFMYINRSQKPLSFEDYRMLRAEVPARYSYGMIQQWQRTINKNKSDWVRLNATNNDYFTSKTYNLAEGRYFNKLEDEQAHKVCILGAEFARTNFPEGALEKMVKVGDFRYQVIGVMAVDKSFMNFNTWERQWDQRGIYIPLSTATRYLTSNGAVDYIYFQSYGDADFAQMKTLIRQNMMRAHNMAHDFQFNDVGAFMFKITDELKDVMKKLNITLSTIASISLIVGGIGLFSTLLISISERMKEIGIRKSIGATEADIFFLFISESIILALLAATIGTLFSHTVVFVVSKALQQQFIVPTQGVIIGFGFSLLIGILSGAYPALKAARINPIAAIYFND